MSTSTRPVPVRSTNSCTGRLPTPATCDTGAARPMIEDAKRLALRAEPQLRVLRSVDELDAREAPLADVLTEMGRTVTVQSPCSSPPRPRYVRVSVSTSCTPGRRTTRSWTPGLSTQWLDAIDKGIRCSRGRWRSSPRSIRSGSGAPSPTTVRCMRWSSALARLTGPSSARARPPRPRCADRIGHWVVGRQRLDCITHAVRS